MTSRYGTEFIKPYLVFGSVMYSRYRAIKNRRSGLGLKVACSYLKTILIM